MKFLTQLFIIIFFGFCLWGLGRIFNHFPPQAQTSQYEFEDLYIDYIDYSFFGVVYEAVRWENGFYKECK